MVIGFKPQFEQKILRRSKILTIREDKHKRWKAGMVIHFATGVRTTNYKQFHLGECYQTKSINIVHNSPLLFGAVAVFVEGQLLSFDQLCKLAFEDGFDSIDEFLEWFDKDFEGVIIYFKIY